MESIETTGNTSASVAEGGADVSEERLIEEFSKFFLESEVMDLVLDDDGDE